MENAEPLIIWFQTLDQLELAYAEWDTRKQADTNESAID